MKTLRIVSILLLAIIMVAGCKKKEETPIVDATTEEAASIMATSFCTGNAGTMTQVEDAVELSQGVALKSTLTDTSFTISSVSGAVITYSYQMNYSFGFVSPNYYQLNYTGSGDYASPNVNASISASGGLNVSGFATGNYFVVSGQSEREGTFTMKIGNKTSMTGTVTTSLSNFNISKSSWLLESGTATIVVNGSTSSGRSFGFTGTLVYTGNYTGTLTISGQQFYINITTGTIQ